MKPPLLLRLLLVALLLPPALSAYIPYNTTQRIDPNKLNVHLVAHTHDDVGWLKTIDQYYVGSNNSIQGACVQNVLDSVVEALLKDSNRRFIYVEQAFFQRWWRQQSEKVKEIVRDLVSSGRLELINGGMCMHDEATTHYIDMIDQTTLGHRFIKEEFGQVPRIGWQIDPFGHSAVQAYLLSAQAGFDALYFFRIDYQDKNKRKETKSLETIWRGSKTFGASMDIFTGIFPKNYEPPTGFYFEVDHVKAIPVQDDPELFDYNVQERVNDFVDAALEQANITRTNHIMWTMGTDFMYQYANTWFSQMDKLIHYVNQDGRVNALYSTPTLYTDAKYATDRSWPLKQEDFFPYADQPNAYWTGYFTSRPGLKGYVRVLSAYYLAARQLEFLGRKTKSPGLRTDRLADALAIAQHHDAVTGTEKQHVANDYAKRLAIGYAQSEKLVGSTLACLTESTLIEGCDNPKIEFQQCPLLNITYCPPSERSIASQLIIVVYNPLGWSREEVIRVPVSSEYTVVQDFDGRQIEAQLLPIANIALDLRNIYTEAYLGKSPGDTPKFWLAFPVSVPPLGFNSYILSSRKSSGLKSAISSVHTYFIKDSGFEIGQGHLRLKYDQTGKLSHYVNSRTAVSELMQQSYNYYSGQNSYGTDPQASGAYVFRPNGTFSAEDTDDIPITVLRGPIVDEVHQLISPWIFQITRLYKNQEHAEIEFIVGPIPIDDGVGKEVATQITTSLATNKIFYTDSNGRDFIKRIRDIRSDWNLEVHQPVAGNYYPVNLGIYVQDDNRELSILVDRSVGGSSLQDGQLELMLHRRLLFDDGRGVDEALNEMVCLDSGCSGLKIQGKFYLRLDPLGEGAKWRRSFGQKIFSPLLLAFAEQDELNMSNSYIPSFTTMDSSYGLPDNVAVITLQVLDETTVLLRLAHLYEAGEDKDLSVMSQVDLKKVFPDQEIIKITEMSLTANQERAEMEKKRLIWKVEGPQTEGKSLRGGPVDPDKLMVELAPMEIRTFVLQFESSSNSCSSV